MDQPVQPQLEEKIRYVAGGTLGEPFVLSALTDVPIDEIQEMTLRGVGLRIQPLEKNNNDFVRSDLDAGWNKRGIPFYGATTFVFREDEETEAHVAEMTRPQWERVKERLGKWNYQDEGWFRFEEIRVGNPDGSVTTYITEMLPDDETLEELPTGYRETQVYQIFTTAMRNGVYTFRAETEGSMHGIEK